jgi:hypothetical protein
MKRAVSEGGKSKSNAMSIKSLPTLRQSPAAKRVALCVDNTGYEVSLEPAKFYRVIPDPIAREHSQIRVIDESGEDYLYPAAFFAHVELPESIRKAVLPAV